MTVNRWLARTAVKLHELWRREAAHDFWRTRQHFCELQARRRALAKAWRRAGKAEKHHLVLIGEFLKRVSLASIRSGTVEGDMRRWWRTILVLPTLHCSEITARPDRLFTRRAAISFFLGAARG